MPKILQFTSIPYSFGLRGDRAVFTIEFSRRPGDMEEFARQLDGELMMLNSDYEAKRYGSIALDRLSIETARPHLFQDWLREKGKLGGQHKIPRLSNNRDIMDELIKMNKI